MKTSSEILLLLFALSVILWFIGDIAVIIVFILLIVPLSIAYWVIKRAEDRDTQNKSVDCERFKISLHVGKIVYGLTVKIYALYTKLRLNSIFHI